MATPGVECSGQPRRLARAFRYRPEANVTSPRCGLGTRSTGPNGSVRAGRPQWDGGVGARVPRSLLRPSRAVRGLSVHRLDRDVDRQPPSITEDIAMTSAVLFIAMSASGFGHHNGGVLYPSAQAPTKVAPAPQAPTKVMP